MADLTKLDTESLGKIIDSSIESVRSQGVEVKASEVVDRISALIDDNVIQIATYAELHGNDMAGQATVKEYQDELHERAAKGDVFAQGLLAKQRRPDPGPAAA